ncbi:MAG TPA: homoserine dehydrogenase [Bacillota bacterium]
MRLILVGFGHVGRDLAKIIAEGFRDHFRVVAIVTGRHGSIIDPGGVDLNAVLHAGLGDMRPGQPTALEVINTVQADTVVELTTLNVYSGRPAMDHVEAALRSGKHAVTANKGPVAWGYERLAGLAKSVDRRFLFESTVMDGIPIFNLARTGLRGCRLLSFRGILNSTSNFILQKMEEGVQNAQAVAAAQAMGFAEADPTLDVDGWDAAAKVAALANVLMGAGITPLGVERTGISDITAADLAGARAKGQTIKLVCEAFGEGEGEGEGGGPEKRLIARVKPTLVPINSDFGRCNGVTSIVTFRTDLLGDFSVTEHEPVGLQTAYGVLNDLLEITREEGPVWPKTRT